MQRVVSINLNGSVYQLEENGYNALFAYLDAAEARLKDNPDRARAASPISSTRSPKSARRRSRPHNTVVTSMEIARIIVGNGSRAGAAAGRSR